jgi:hypothetical protein
MGIEHSSQCTRSVVGPTFRLTTKVRFRVFQTCRCTAQLLVIGRGYGLEVRPGLLIDSEVKLVAEKGN